MIRTGSISFAGPRRSTKAYKGGDMNFLLFFGALCAVRTGAEAISKGRSGHGNKWFALGLFLNILALVCFRFMSPE
jgi:hypothetical protein